MFICLKKRVCFNLKMECDLIDLHNRTYISLNSLVLSDFISCILAL